MGIPPRYSRLQFRRDPWPSTIVNGIHHGIHHERGSGAIPEALTSRSPEDDGTVDYLGELIGYLYQLDMFPERVFGTVLVL